MNDEVDSWENSNFSRKRRKKDCFLLAHNLKNKKVSVRDKISSRCAICFPAVKCGPSFAEVSQAISVAKSSQYNVLHNGHIWISQFLSSYPVILTFADISYLIEWTYRISHAFFWEWFLPLTWSTVPFRSRARAPPDALSSAPPPSPSSCLTTPFGRFFVNRDESTFHPPRGSKSKASLASNPMEGLHQRTLRQGDPSSLVEMILKVEKRGFRTMEKRDQRFFP